jgi:hypothetical protein
MGRRYGICDGGPKGRRDVISDGRPRGGRDVIRDDNDPVHMVGHHLERIQDHVWVVQRYRIPAQLHHPSCIVQVHEWLCRQLWRINDAAIQMRTFVRADGDEIRAGLAIVVPA